MMSKQLKQTQFLPLMDGRRLRKVVSDVSSELNNVGKDFEAITNTEEVKQAQCDCCGLKEDCTQDYITTIKLFHFGKWVCGLCSEAVKETDTKTPRAENIEVAVNSHRKFCQEFNATTRLNPKLSLTNDMRNIARRSFESRRSLDY